MENQIDIIKTYSHKIKNFKKMHKKYSQFMSLHKNQE